MNDHSDEHEDPLRPHSHEPNPQAPDDKPDFLLLLPDDQPIKIRPSDLRLRRQHMLPDCYIVSTGHGTSGPFTFGGVTLLDLIQAHWQGTFADVEVVSADGFGNRIFASELESPSAAGPILLAISIDGRPLTRQNGLVRLIVPSERDDALRQVKWISKVRVVGKSGQAKN